jgi:hypothetical protein
VADAIVRPLGEAGNLSERLWRSRVERLRVSGRPASDSDLQLALDVCYELHFLSFRGVDPRWEWDSELLELRSAMEAAFLGEIGIELGPAPDVNPDRMAAELRSLRPHPETLELTSWIEQRADLDQLREALIHRSPEALRTPDPYLLSIPRLRRTEWEALDAIETSERPRQELFACALHSFGLDARRGAYRDLLPGETLATLNLLSMFSLRRQARGALAGRLAMRHALVPAEDLAFSRAMRRLGINGDGAAYFEASTAPAAQGAEAATLRLAAALAREEPSLAPDIIFGARAHLLAEKNFAEWLTGKWGAGQSSLLPE